MEFFLSQKVITVLLRMILVQVVGMQPAIHHKLVALLLRFAQHIMHDSRMRAEVETCVYLYLCCKESSRLGTSIENIAQLKIPCGYR
jgi:hypothetical protein